MRRYNAASTFVPAEASLEIDPLMEHALTQNVERDVWVPLFENILGGCGLFVAAICARLWWIEYETTSIWVSTGYWAGMGTGVACIIRFWGDEIIRVARYFWQLWAERRTNEELEWYKEECKRLNRENRELSIVNAQMTRKAPPPERVAVQDEYTELLANASKLCRFYNDHGTIAREKVTEAKLLNKPQWEATCQFLKSAGVTVNRGMLNMQPPMVMAKAREFVEKQRQAPDGFVMPDAE